VPETWWIPLFCRWMWPLFPSKKLPYLRLGVDAAALGFAAGLVAFRGVLCVCALELSLSRSLRHLGNIRCSPRFLVLRVLTSIVSIFKA
jgi:hypothetical protein